MKRCTICNKADSSESHEIPLSNTMVICVDCYRERSWDVSRAIKNNIKERSSKYYKELSKEVLKERRVKNYGITSEDYDKMLLEQNNSCAICKVHLMDLKKTPNIDHCHSTGKVRGLLCNNCNFGLGFFKDNVDNMLEAILYLKKSQK